MGSLRLLFVLITVVIAVVAASANVVGVEKVVKIDRISAVQDSNTVVVVGLKLQQKITDGKVTISVPELGLRARRNVDFEKSGKQTAHIVIPVQSLLDQYVRVVFNSDNGHRVKYRQVITE